MPFPGSEEYWINRYKRGKSSGAGSYLKLAEFKAEVINRFLVTHGIKEVIEFGCGDGNQLKLLTCPQYIGFDVSPEAVELCKDELSDPYREFFLMSEYSGQTAELTLSLDVIYHLIEEEVFRSYMSRLFDASEKYVIIYSSNTNNKDVCFAPHVKHRKFTGWIKRNRPEWKFYDIIQNKYPWNGNRRESSFADFYIFKKETCDKVAAKINNSPAVPLK